MRKARIVNRDCPPAAARQDSVLLAQRDVAAHAADVADVQTHHVLDRYAADGIIDTAKACNSDLVVMTSHGRRGVTRVLLGSQTSEVLARSTVPVLVIR